MDSVKFFGKLVLFELLYDSEVRFDEDFPTITKMSNSYLYSCSRRSKYLKNKTKSLIDTLASNNGWARAMT